MQKLFADVALEVDNRAKGGFLLEDVSTEMDAAYETPNLSTHADG